MKRGEAKWESKANSRRSLESLSDKMEVCQSDGEWDGWEQRERSRRREQEMTMGPQSGQSNEGKVLEMMGNWAKRRRNWVWWGRERSRQQVWMKGETSEYRKAKNTGCRKWEQVSILFSLYFSSFKAIFPHSLHPQISWRYKILQF